MDNHNELIYATSQKHFWKCHKLLMHATMYKVTEYYKIDINFSETSFNKKRYTHINV